MGIRAHSPCGAWSSTPHRRRQGSAELTGSCRCAAHRLGATSLRSWPSMLRSWKASASTRPSPWLSSGGKWEPKTVSLH